MYRQFGQQPFQPLPGQQWDFTQPFMPTPGPTPTPPPQPLMTFEQMYAILGEMYEMIRCVYEKNYRNEG